MGLHLPNIPTILTPIPDTSRGQHWLGERPSPRGAHGPTTGAIAIGITAMRTSKTKTISIRTTTRTSTKELVPARPTAGNTTRNTGETPLTLTNKQRTSTAARQLAVLENQAVQAVRVALVAPGNPAVRAVRVAL